MKYEKEYIELLKMLFEIVEANKGTPARENCKILDAEGLASKFFFHCSTILYLARSTTLTELNCSFFDFASINVLARSALESFLVFQYIFASPKSNAEQDLRYYSWVLSGLLDTQNFPIFSEEAKRKVKSEIEIIKSVKEKLKANEDFNNLSKKQKEKILEKGGWRLSSWRQIALSAGLDKTHATAVYRYLCGYAHAGRTSTTQIRNAKTASSQQDMSNATITFVIIAISNMIKSYCEFFPKSKKVLNAKPNYSHIINKWILIGASNLEEKC